VSAIRRLLILRRFIEIRHDFKRFYAKESLDENAFYAFFFPFSGAVASMSTFSH